MPEGMETRQIRRDAPPFAVREEGGDRFIEGYFARFDDVYDMGWGITESIDPHAFDETIRDDDVRVLTDHDSARVLGRTTAKTAELRVDSTGLWGRVKINPADTDAMNTLARVERGDVTGASFGFEIREINRAYAGDGAVHRTLMKVRLFEVSVCTFPAYEKTELGARNQNGNAAAEENRLWREKQKERVKKWH